MLIIKLELKSLFARMVRNNLNKIHTLIWRRKVNSLSQSSEKWRHYEVEGKLEEANRNYNQISVVFNVELMWKMREKKASSLIGAENNCRAPTRQSKSSEEIELRNQIM
jgi:hypothetical protein